MKTPNNGERISLRSNINRAEKALHVAELNHSKAVHRATVTEEATAAAEAALNKTNPASPTWNDVAKKYRDAKAQSDAARVASIRTGELLFSAKEKLTTAKELAKKGNAI